jgi:hypothetical protein
MAASYVAFEVSVVGEKVFGAVAGAAGVEAKKLIIGVEVGGRTFLAGKSTVRRSS